LITGDYDRFHTGFARGYFEEDMTTRTQYNNYIWCNLKFNVYADY